MNSLRQSTMIQHSQKQYTRWHYDYVDTFYNDLGEIKYYTAVEVRWVFLNFLKLLLIITTQMKQLWEEKQFFQVLRFKFSLLVFLKYFLSFAWFEPHVSYILVSYRKHVDSLNTNVSGCVVSENQRQISHVGLTQFELFRLFVYIRKNIWLCFHFL